MSSVLLIRTASLLVSIQNYASQHFRDIGDGCLGTADELAEVNINVNADESAKGSVLVCVICIAALVFGGLL